MIGHPFWETCTFDEAYRVSTLYHELVSVFALKPRSVRTDTWGRVQPLGNYSLNIREAAMMARQRRSGAATRTMATDNPKQEKMVWVNVKFTEEMENDALLLCNDVAACAAEFIGLVGEGYDITLKRADSTTFMACAYANDSAGQRFGISSWAETPLDACAALTVKVRWTIDHADLVDAAPTVRPRFR